MKFGILKEKDHPLDARVVFSPTEIVQLKSLYPRLDIKVESSDSRSFSDFEYSDKGIEVVEDLGDCDIFFGINEREIKELIPNKTYFFHAKNIKKNPNYLDFVQELSAKKTTIYDFDAFEDYENQPLIDYRKHKGFVGGYHTIRAFGLKFELFKLPKIDSVLTKEKMIFHLKRLVLPPIKIIITGKGKISEGIQEVLSILKIKEVTLEHFLTKKYTQSVYVLVDTENLFTHIEDKPFDLNDFTQNPNNYRSDFERFAKVSDIVIAGHENYKNRPQLLTQKMMNSSENQIKIVGDLTTNSENSLACMLKSTQATEAFYGYLATENKEIDIFHPAAIVITAINNLESELPRETAQLFGSLIANRIIPALFNGDKDGILQKARVS